MIINLISGPRNISTALMYSFAQRGDTKVIDEPFYAFYLNQFPQLDHPGREDVLKCMSSDPEKILKQIEELHQDHPILFLKNMAHHHLGLDWSYMKSFKNVFLIRNPKQLIASFAQVISNPTLQDIGLKEEADLLTYVEQTGDHAPIVIDSNQILPDPEEGLRKLCEDLTIPFQSEMLSWKKGPIPEDGVWATYWYHNVHNSTGFAKQPTSDRPLPTHCEVLYQEALPYFEKLHNYTLKH